MTAVVGPLVAGDVAIATPERPPSPTGFVLVGPALAAGAACGLAVSGRAGAWLLLVVSLVAYHLSDRRHSVLASVPAAALITVTTLIAVLTLAGSLGTDLLAHTSSSRSLLVTLSAVVVPFLAAGHRRDRGKWALPAEGVACAPGLVVLVLGIWLVLQDLPHAVGGLLAGWDNGAHVLMSAALNRTGDLSYDADPYPRGLHAIVALVMSARGPTTAAPEVLESLLRTQSLLVWGMYALLAATVGLTTLRCAALRELRPRVAASAACLAGLATLTPDFFNFTMMYGFQTTTALAVILAIVSLEVLDRRPPALRAVLLAAALAAATHTYQVAIPAVSVPFLVATLALMRAGARHRVRPLVVICLFLLAAWPPAWSVLVNTGVGVAGADGAAGPLPVLALSAGLAATLWWWTSTRERLLQVLPWTVLTLLAVTVATAGVAGAALTDYYPRKLLWHVALLTLPLTVTAVTAALTMVSRRTCDTPFLRLTSPSAACLAVLMVVGLAVPGPYLAVSGAWGLPPSVLHAMLQPKDGGLLCDIEGEYARQVALRMQHFYTPVPRPPAPHLKVLPDCATAPDRS